jgi:SAM-dependent methyltransferase
MQKDVIKEVIREPVKSRIIWFLYNYYEATKNELAGNIFVHKDELQKALDFMVAHNMIKYDNGYYRETEKGSRIAYALKGYEYASKSSWSSSCDVKVPTHSNLLDVGCGGGVTISTLQKHNLNHLVGVDIDLGALYIAKIKCDKGEFILADAHHLPFKNEIFNVIISYFAIPYMDEERTIAAMSRSLKSGGIISLKLHGIGWYLKNIFSNFRNSKLKGKIYSMLVILNTLIYWLTNKELINDVFQIKCRTSKILKENKIEIFKIDNMDSYLSFPIFINVKGKRP